MNGTIESILWPGMHKLEPKSKLGGIVARKPGYHNSRDHLPSSDYSVREFSQDRYGPVNLGSAIDWTFPDAQAGHYGTINKYSNRLMSAGKSRDPRTVYMREFFGNTDSDHEVEGWDYSKHVPSSSDSSHLWHLHISIHREYINNTVAMQAILSILSGQSLTDWKKGLGGTGKIDTTPIIKPPAPTTGGSAKPVLKSGATGTWVTQLQKGLNRVFPAYSSLKVDGEYGAKSVAVVKEFQKRTGLLADGQVGPKTWAMLDRYGVI